jgi:hypothetical protein
MKNYMWGYAKKKVEYHWFRQLWVLLYVHRVMYCVFVFSGKRILRWEKKAMIQQLTEASDIAVTPMSLIWLRESSWNTRSLEMHVCCFFFKLKY